MQLVVHIPHRMTEADSSALSLAQRAPHFTIEWMMGERVNQARFPLLPEGLDCALQLIGEAIRLDGAWASMNDRRMSSLVKLWHRLECYRESLVASDPFRHCVERAVLFNALVGCEAHRCPVPCQFICSPCMGTALEGPSIQAETRFHDAATAAEIDWCPRLTLPSRSEARQAPLLNPDPSTR